MCCHAHAKPNGHTDANVDAEAYRDPTACGCVRDANPDADRAAYRPNGYCLQQAADTNGHANGHTHADAHCGRVAFLGSDKSPDRIACS